MENTWHERPPPPARRSYPGRRQLTPEQVKQARVAAKNGWSYYAIGKRLNVAGATIRAIITGRSYQDVE